MKIYLTTLPNPMPTREIVASFAILAGSLILFVRVIHDIFSHYQFSRVTVDINTHNSIARIADISFMG